ncbi:MAG: phospholipase A [Acinetobacter sp.]|nr:phospholipase A [Acinetobacter sp.]
MLKFYTPFSCMLLTLPVTALAMTSTDDELTQQQQIQQTSTPVLVGKMPPQPSNVQACVALNSNSERLACYDAIFRLNHEQKQQIAQERQADKDFQQQAQLQQNALPEQATLREKIAHSVQNTTLLREGDDFDPNTSYLDQHWELSENSKLGTWNLRSYQPVYVFPVFATTNRNLYPKSPNPANTVTERQNLQSYESKFQVSFKTKAIENLIGNNGDVWLGYTQSSRWQVYNGEESRPFRETNYEPEAQLIFRTNYDILGLNARLLGVGFNHQSNGRSDPFSRSWNRIIFSLGLEKDNFAMIIRPWVRVGSDSENDNADIANYMGRGDLTALYKHNDYNYSLMLRHSLKGGADAHGAVRADWTFPIRGKLRGHVQAFHGYGESLIDYNHRSTYFGVGVSLEDGF